MNNHSIESCFTMCYSASFSSDVSVTMKKNKSFKLENKVQKRYQLQWRKISYSNWKRIKVQNLTKVKHTLSILQIYWKYASKVYLKYTSSILEAYYKYSSSIIKVYFKYTSTCWMTEEEVYFKSILFPKKKYIWSTFSKINSAF